MSRLQLVIGNKNYSSWSLRAWLAMRHAGIPFDEILIPLHEANSLDEKLQHAPSGRVPVLKDGDLAIWDSLAICEHVAETHPDLHLWPDAPHARARARSICAEMHSSFENLRSDMPMNCRARKTRKSRRAEVERDIARIQTCWRSTREEFGAEGPFLFGKFSIADSFYAPVASRFFTYDIEVDETARAYQDALFSLPAMQQWMIEAENEAMSIGAIDQID